MTVSRAAIVLAFTVLAACSQPKQDNGIASAGGAGANAPSAGAAAGSAGTDAVKEAKCLRDQGIPAGDPPTPDGKPYIPESVTREQLDAAMEHCKQFAPNYGKEPPPVEPARLELLRRFAACMREQGVAWEDPDPHGRPAEPADPGKRSGDRPDPQLIIDAVQVCDGKVPGTGISFENGDGSPKQEPK